MSSNMKHLVNVYLREFRLFDSTRGSFPYKLLSVFPSPQSLVHVPSPAAVVLAVCHTPPERRRAPPQSCAPGRPLAPVGY